MALRAHLKEHDFLLEMQRSQAKATVRCVKIDHPCPCSLPLSPAYAPCPLPPQLPLNCGRPTAAAAARERGERRGE